MTSPPTVPGRQPRLHELVAALAAPTQLRCGPGGDAGGGVERAHRGDVRVLSVVRVEASAVAVLSAVEADGVVAGRRTRAAVAPA